MLLSQPGPGFVSPSCDCVHAAPGACQGYGLLSLGAPDESRAAVDPCLHWASLESAKDFGKSVQRQLQGRGVGGWLVCHLGWWGWCHTQAIPQSTSTLSTQSLYSAPESSSPELHYYCSEGMQFISQTVNISSKSTHCRCGCQAPLSPSSPLGERFCLIAQAVGSPSPRRSSHKYVLRWHAGFITG